MKRLSLLIIMLFTILSIAHALTVEEIIANIQSNQARIKDMSADTVTTITSTMKGAKEMKQKGKILMKYPDKSRVEVFSPVHQVTINNGEKIIIINKSTGQRFEQDLSEMKGPQANTNNGQMDFEKAKEYFDFSVASDGDTYVVTGIPKDDNKYLGKMQFIIDSEKWLPVKVKVYTPTDKLISESVLEYEFISDVWVMTKNTTNMSMPMGKMRMEVEYTNVKVNQRIRDLEFEI